MAGERGGGERREDNIRSRDLRERGVGDKIRTASRMHIRHEDDLINGGICT